MSSRVNLYEELYDDLIDDRGHRAEWQRAAVCHCVSRDSGQPDFMCPTCGGSGYRYLPPQNILVVVTSLAGQIELKTLELREPGTAYVTPKSDVVMGYRDRLRFTDFNCIFSEVLQWSEANNGRGISPRTYRNIKNVISLVDDKYQYDIGIDFEITEDKYHLKWLNEDYIDKLDGKNMSLLYTTTPSYIVTDLLHELRGTISDRNSASKTFRELPKQYKVQREDFIYKVSEPEPIEKPENPSEPNEEDGEETDNNWNIDEDGGIVI